ncbi:hypothetical protein [Fontivita pretiosa]|uniref:hypothetical protein n=1 Tax=Fontivita pretiosa TaxID=2989684 RepID=UPI003D17561D
MAETSHQVPARASATIATSRDAIAFAITCVLLLAMYLPLQNRWWVPGGDSEVYIAIARNLALGNGYLFNGQPVSMVPPGWSQVMAWLMKLSPSFLLLKLVNMSCMFGALAIGYWICRRFAGPALSALVIVTSGILSHIYSLTFWLHSDALFCLISSAALLLAMRINEAGQHRSWWWRFPLLVLLCAASVWVRWAGIFTWLLVAAALYNGRLVPRWDRLMFTLLLSGAVTAATFFGLRYSLASAIPQDKARLIKSWASDEPPTPIIARADATVAQAYRFFDPGGEGVGALFGRAGNWGQWFSYLLWQPLRLGWSNKFVGAVALLIGWIVLLPLLVHACWAATRAQWLWPAMLLYALALALNWPRPNARYYVPLAFLIVLGVFKGMQIIRQRFPADPVVAGCKVALGYFVASLLLCNGALWAVDLSVARSDNFYARYEAGLNRDLIQAARWLNDRAVQDGEIAVSEYYVNLGRGRISRLGLRATTMLTGKAIVSVPIRYTRQGADPRRNSEFLKWARSTGIKYVLYQPPVSPWRVFHFRMPWLQEAMTGEPAYDTGAGWRLYEIPPQGQEAIRVSIQYPDDWPTRVPGM